MRFLLLPEDEREFLDWAHTEQGLDLVAVAETETGLSRLTPISQPPDELPGSRGYQTPKSVPSEFVLRRPDWGINDLEPWETDTPVAHVMRALNTEAAEKAGVSPDDLINLERTRVIRYRRCGWIRPGELHVGALQGSVRPARLQDATVADLGKSAERWLMRGSTRIELPEEIRYRPRIFVRPRAHDWVMSGGTVHPWDA